MSWEEGRYLDGWVFVHALSGFAGGLSNVFWGLGPLRSYGLAVTLMIVWEAGEWVAGIRESLSNRIIDIVVGMIGVELALRTLAVVSPAHGRLAFAGAFVLSVAGSLVGARAYRRRTRQEDPRN